MLLRNTQNIQLDVLSSATPHLLQPGFAKDVPVKLAELDTLRRKLLDIGLQMKTA